MAHVVTDDCIRCKFGDCIIVCPTNAFHAGPNMLVIDPDECIDCTLCVPDCPADAIYAEEDLPIEQHGMIALNIELARLWPVVSEQPDPLPDADRWKGVKDKLQYLVR